MKASYLETATKRNRLARSRIYRAFGVRGLKCYARTLVACLLGYLLVVAFAVEFVFLAVPSLRSPFIATLTLILVAITLPLLARMQRDFLAEIADLESAESDEQ